MAGAPLARILVADDEPSILELMRTVLSLWGYKVELCSHGGEALKLASKGEFELLLIDNEMPVLNGIEVLQKLRSTNRVLPAILMSGHISKQVELMCRDLGNIDILPKPFSLDELRDSLERFLGPRGT